MRARTFFFALVCGTATAALAQDSGYVRFPSPSPDACAVACAGDQMCASWSFGTAARSYGQSQARSEGGGMCTFSGSSNVRTAPGMVTGLPRRQANVSSVPTMSGAPNQGRQSYAPAPTGQSSMANAGASGWGVRAAPWLSGTGSAQQIYPTPQTQIQTQAQQSRGAPQQLGDIAALPTPSSLPAAGASGGPRIDFEPQSRPAPPNYYPPPVQVQIPAPQSQPQFQQQRVYVAPTPSYTPPPVQVAPILQIPAPPPRTRALEGASSGASSDSTSVALPTRTRPGRGVPKGRTVAPRPATIPAVQDVGVATIEEAVPMVGAPVVAPIAAPVVATPEAPAVRRAARGTPRSAANATPASTTGPQAAAPARQETTARPTTGRGAPRAPVRDPNNPESFRGADGMIDSAEMRRAQLNAAREQGTPAYSVQREWEAVAAERQRADAAGEARVDPLAGTVPVAPPPETRAQKRAREAEEAVVAAEEARDAARANGDSVAEEEAAQTPQRRPTARGARGTPRAKRPAQTSQNDAATQVADSSALPRRARASRRAPAQALDREPRLSGGPG